ncbi:TPA: right-handed parallel beta-helix repeat-containing protein [Candidatus Poribacteria bacterium]|nr:right-handed parallel beta-helix repeat-containing protein [Candidatus Poribacteria bacterium]HIA65024.1 right-handed parallel beta-helix repeat-containing protein [Candidatus Poribacteria bacterium]
MNIRSYANGVPIILPDGTEFPFWQDETEYRRMYYVDQQHPGASDGNSGTEEAPFLTIQRAAEVVEPAEKVLIKSGIYREWVQPRRSGNGADEMISFEAAPGAEAIIRGSQVLSARWTNSDVARSVSVWAVDLPEEFFEGDHPFAVVNTTEEDFEIMRWARGERGRIPHILPRAMVFQNGRRLIQLGSCDELPRVAGAFWIDVAHHKLHLNPFDRTNPNKVVMEVTTRQYLFNPQVKGLGYIRIKGLTFEHAGNGFIRSGNGAVTTWGGNHWIIEDNTVRQINAVAIEIGAFTDERSESGDREVLEKRTGGHLVRGNHVSDCGTGGIQGTVVSRSLVTNNHIHDCGWQEVQSYLETGGIKILLTLDSVVQCNYIHHCHAAPGIWIDCANRNSRVCRNLLHDIAAANGAIFFEASNAPNQIDHNIIYNVEGGSGIYQRDCNQLLIAHNLIQNCSAAGVRMRKTQHRDRVGVCKNNRVVNNIIASCPVAFDYEIMENISNYNLLSNIGEDFSLGEWQATGLDIDSRMAELNLVMDPRDQCLTWSSQADAVLRVRRDEYQSLDYFGRSYPGVEIPVGPFTEGWSSVCRRLRLTPNS